jgi:hypothetical protein
LDHDVTVAMLAVRIAPDERTADKAWAAAMLHSIDRLIPKGDDPRSLTWSCGAELPSGFFSTSEVAEICEAACRHGEMNQPDQSVTQQVLQDADRLANLQLTVVIRSGQFQPEIPAFEFEFLSGKRNPASTYYEPRNILDDFRTMLIDYPPSLRTPAGKELGARYARDLQDFISKVEASYEELDLRGITL